MKLARRNFTLAGLAFLAGAVVTGGMARARIRSAEAEFPPIGQYVTVNGIQIHYVRKGTGPDLVLLHGAGGNLREFTFDLLDRLTDRYTVTVFDRPGMGYSDGSNGVTKRAFASEGESPAQQAEILRAAAAALGLRNPIIVGHSFGAIVCMAWALAGLDEPDAPHNASAVVSLSGVLMPWPGDLGLYYRINGSAFGGLVTIPFIAGFASDNQIDTTISAIFSPQPNPAGYADYVGASLTLRPEQFRANVRQVNSARPHVVTMSARYCDLILPIEIVHGDADVIVPIHVHPLEMIKIVDTANLTALPGIGHMPHHVDPASTIAAIDRASVRAGLR